MAREISRSSTQSLKSWIQKPLKTSLATWVELFPSMKRFEGCSSRMIRRIMHGLVQQLETVDDFLPATVLSRYQLPDRKTALLDAHFPPPQCRTRAIAALPPRFSKEAHFRRILLFGTGIGSEKAEIKNLAGISFSDRASRYEKNSRRFSPSIPPLRRSEF